MNKYFVEQAENTPGVSLDMETGIFEIKGVSRPENVQDFYDPILAWFDDYMKEAAGKNVELTIFLEYFNSSSAKYILNILKKMAEFLASGITVKVNWNYEDGDEDMLEVGEEMQRMVRFNFNFVVV
jgi:hypothetical protein